MRPLTTPVQFDFPFSLGTYPRRFASIGSCFSEKIVNFLLHADFECISNPNGIVYNPHSIAESVRHIAEDLPYEDDTFFFFNGKFHSREHHGSFSSDEKDSAEEKVETARKTFRDFLTTAPCPVALTFGTAVVFREKKSGRIAANCHKVPGTEFDRELMTPDDCFKAISSAAEQIFRLGDHPVLLSVSPVRHHPGDPVLNSRSKSILIEACHETVECFPGKCAYFPSFELLHDELRDYRFYADDLVHPSAFAEEIILETFLRKGYGNQAEEILSVAGNNIKQKKHIPGGVI